jgi:hypothetical protein
MNDVTWTRVPSYSVECLVINAAPEWGGTDAFVFDRKYRVVSVFFFLIPPFVLQWIERAKVVRDWSGQ